MSERNENSSDVNAVVNPWSIGQTAEFELWQRGRDATRRRLSSAVTAGFLYLMAALVVGAYLILMVAAVARGAVVMDGWNATAIDLSWTTQIVWCYGGLALLAIIFYPLLLLLIHGRLPSPLSRCMRMFPGIGSTMRMVELGDFCQSMYQSLAQSQTYEQAFTQASNNARDAGLRQWAHAAACRLETGQSLAGVLRSTPVRDQPLPAILAFVQSDISQSDTLRVWHHAAEECHLQSQRRLKRTTQAISVSCMLAAVFLAAFGMLMAATITHRMLQGWSMLTYSPSYTIKWLAEMGISEWALIPIALGILLVATLLRGVNRISRDRGSGRWRWLLPAVLTCAEWSLWGLGLMALVVGLPHPITIVLAVMIIASLVIAGRWRQRDEVESLNPWLRLATDTNMSIPVLVESLADGFQGRLAEQARSFAARMKRGESMVAAVRRSQLPVHADTLAALAISPANLVGQEATRRPSEAPHRTRTRRQIVSGDDSTSQSPVLVSEQFVYVVATVLLAWLISRMVRSVTLPFFTSLADEFFNLKDFATPGLDLTVMVGNVVVTVMVVWLLAAFSIAELPLWMVRWVPWFGRLAIDRWRCGVLRTIAHGVRGHQSASEILQFASATTPVRWIRRGCETAKQSVDHGVGLAASLRRAQFIAAREESWLNSAEKNAVLAETIEQIVDNIRRRQTLLWKVRKSWLVPLATVGVGIYVLVHGVVVFQFLSRVIGWNA
ncbi:type II secretion system F family protein [Allorhodopirellula heiligendammensis]|uniref:Bacterial type II secretion system protein F domain protein n=1 Tax=Allorhodopirellula heiligendammensis TaxID=2714739 RepID=A0A5C6BJQ7_9BACT|nr:type II secretion system F family protein [Allorhodopirellula heiligendammensis]TWU10694.1 Bacterial type II secretion system protein F domain protein [Allorhodopirellula heiligendammensis]